MKKLRFKLASLCAIDDFSHHIKKKRRRGECTQVYKQWRQVFKCTEVSEPWIGLELELLNPHPKAPLHGSLSDSFNIISGH